MVTNTASTGACRSIIAVPPTPTDWSPPPVQLDTNAAIALALLSSRIGYRTQEPSVYHRFIKRIKNAEWITPDLGGKRTCIVTPLPAIDFLFKFTRTMAVVYCVRSVGGADNFRPH